MNNQSLVGVIDIDVDGYLMPGLVGIISREIEIVDPVVEPLEVTENGEYSAPENVHGFSPVNVNVPLKYEEGYNDGYQASQDSITLQEKTITENGEYETDEGFTGISKVTVAVPIKEEQEKTVQITANGTTEVVADEGKSMSKVTVNTNVAFDGDIGKPYIDTSKMTDFSWFCYYGARTEVLDLFDTSNGTNFKGMFASLPERSLGTIPPLDTSNGVDFYNMFSNSSYIKTISSLDTSNGTSLGYMFQSCASLRTIPPLDTSKNKDFTRTFYGCKSLETISITTAQKNLATDTFQACTALKNLTIGEGWAVNIYLHYSNNLTVESLHGMIENLADLTGQTAKTFQIGETNLAKIDDEHMQMLTAKNWAYS